MYSEFILNLYVACIVLSHLVYYNDKQDYSWFSIVIFRVLAVIIITAISLLRILSELKDSLGRYKDEEGELSFLSHAYFWEGTVRVNGKQVPTGI